MKPEIEDIAKELRERLSPKELEALAYELEIEAKDKYYVEQEQKNG